MGMEQHDTNKYVVHVNLTVKATHICYASCQEQAEKEVRGMGREELFQEKKSIGYELNSVKAEQVSEQLEKPHIQEITFCKEQAQKQFQPGEVLVQTDSFEICASSLMGPKRMRQTNSQWVQVPLPVVLIDPEIGVRSRPDAFEKLEYNNRGYYNVLYYRVVDPEQCVKA